MDNILNFFYEDENGNSNFKNHKYFKNLKFIFKTIFDLTIFLFPYYIIKENFQIAKIAIQILLISILLNLLFSNGLSLKSILLEILTPIPISILGYIILLKTGVDVYSESRDFIISAIFLAGYVAGLVFFIWFILKSKKQIRRIALIVTIFATLINIFLIYFFDIPPICITLNIVIPNFLVQCKYR